MSDEIINPDDADSSHGGDDDDLYGRFQERVQHLVNHGYIIPSTMVDTPSSHWRLFSGKAQVPMPEIVHGNKVQGMKREIVKFINQNSITDLDSVTYDGNFQEKHLRRLLDKLYIERAMNFLSNAKDTRGDESVPWRRSKQGTLVRHVINTEWIGGAGVPEDAYARAARLSPATYVLEDVRSGRLKAVYVDHLEDSDSEQSRSDQSDSDRSGSDDQKTHRETLVSLYYQTCYGLNADEKHLDFFYDALHGMLKDFMSTMGAGIAFPMGKSNPAKRESAAEQIERLKHHLNTLECIPERPRTGTRLSAPNFHYDMEYEHGYIKTYVDMYDDNSLNALDILVSPVSFSCEGPINNVLPGDVTPVIDELVNVGCAESLFVELRVWEAGSVVQHCLLLTDYAPDHLRATCLLTRPVGPFDWQHFAIPENKVIRVIPDRRPFQVSVPYVETDLYRYALETLLRFVGLDTLDNADVFIRNFQDCEAELAKFTYLESELPFKIDFISEEGMCFLVIAFNPAYDCVRHLLGIGQRDDQVTTRYFALGMRYPLLFTNLERSMSIMRYKYFMSQGGNPDFYKLWKIRQWNFNDPAPDLDDTKLFPALPQAGPRHVPPPRPQYKPEEYQEKPAQIAPAAEFFVKDRQGKLVYPHRRVNLLPPSLSYASYVRRHGRGPEIFCVNDLDDDPAIFFICLMSDFPAETTWDDLQLMRLNHEVEVSKAVVAEKGECFYSFRLKLVNSRGIHPFRRYLAQYPTGKAVWRRLWDQIYNGEGVVRSVSWHRRSEVDPEVGSHRNSRRVRGGPVARRRIPAPVAPVVPVVPAAPAAEKQPIPAAAQQPPVPVNDQPADDQQPPPGNAREDQDFWDADRPHARDDQRFWDINDDRRLTVEERTQLHAAGIALDVFTEVRRWLIVAISYVPSSPEVRAGFVGVCKAVQDTLGKTSAGVDRLLREAYVMLHDNDHDDMSKTLGKLASCVVRIRKERDKQKRQREIQEAGERRLRHPDNFRNGAKGAAPKPNKTKSSFHPSSRSLNQLSLSVLCARRRYREL